jgi:hypothetical protein
MTVYLLHSDTPVGNYRHTARHYVGYCTLDTLGQRMGQHANGTGAKIVRAFMEVGACVYLVRIWTEGTRATERRLKRVGHLSLYCPVCRVVPHSVVGFPESVLLTQDSPLYRLHWLRRASTNTGASAPTSPTGDTGWFQAELPLPPPTSWPSDRDRLVRTRGGGASPARVQPRRQASTWRASTRRAPISGYTINLWALLPRAGRRF